MVTFFRAAKILHKILGVLCCLFAKVLFAATATAAFQVKATVGAACTIGASDLNFGNYVLGQASSGTTSISVVCTNTTGYNVGLSTGAGTVANRYMPQQGVGTGTLLYNLYKEAAHTNIWGNTVGTDTVSGTGNGTTQILTVYGLIPANNPNAIPDAVPYIDNITATITF